MEEKDRTISHLKAELAVVTQRQKILAEEAEVAKIQQDSNRDRVRVLEQELEYHKSKSERLEFVSKVKFLYNDQPGTKAISADYQSEFDSLQS